MHRGAGAELAITATLLTLLTTAPSQWYARIPLATLACMGLLLPSLRLASLFWLPVTAVMFISNVLNWHSADNHKYLLAYWVLAVFLASNSKHTRRHLRDSARWLTAGTFTFAVFWKLYNSDFMTGEFFRFSLLSDKRFNFVTKRICGLSTEMYESNLEVLRELRNGNADVTAGVF